MRKIFTLLTLCLLASAAWAVDITFDATVDIGTGGTTAAPYQVVKDGITMDVSNGLVNGHYRIYKGQTCTFTSAIGEITDVKFECTASGDAQYGPGCLTANVGSYTYAEKIGTWTGSASTIVFTASTNQVRATKITVTVGQAGLAAPSISPAGGTFYQPISVSITCPSSGAKIYYTTNGNDPTTSSTQYTAPFTVSSNTTVKAISALNGEVSSVVSATYEFATATSVANIAAYQGVADGTVVIFTNPVNALAQNGRYLYVKDNTGYALIYGNNVGQTYRNGDVIPAGFVGTKTTYAGEPELQAESGFAPASSNSPIDPETISADQVGHNKFAHYVTMENVTFYTEDNRNYTLTDANGKTCAVYFGSMGVSAPTDLSIPYNVIGVVGSYGNENTIYQLLPTSIKKPGDSFGFRDMASTEDNEMVEFTDEIIVVKQGGNGNNYLYAMDANEPRGYGLIYGNVGQTYNPGDVIAAGISGKKTTYNAEPELATPFEGFAPAIRNVNIKQYAKTITCSQVSHDTWAQYVLIKQVTINTSDQTFTDASGSCPYYNGTFNTPIPSDVTKKYDVYCVIASYGKNNTIYQVLPLEFVGDGGGPQPPIEVPCIEDLYGLSQGQMGKFTKPLIAIYQYGPNLYVKDDCGTYSLVYGTLTYKDFINGDVIDGAIASWTTYNGAKQMVPVDSTFVTTHYVEPVQPEVMPCEELSTEMVHNYIRIDDAKIFKDGNNTMVDDGTLPVILFNKFGIEIPEDDADHTVWGFLTIYRNELEIYPIAIDNDPTPPYPREEEYIPGDVNGDGEVNIGDINTLIDIILGGTDKTKGRADVNKDGEVNIGDINAVIDIILRG
jgi:hypothetical protein